LVGAFLVDLAASKMRPHRVILLHWMQGCRDPLLVGTQPQKAKTRHLLQRSGSSRFATDQPSEGMPQPLRDHTSAAPLVLYVDRDYAVLGWHFEALGATADSLQSATERPQAATG